MANIKGFFALSDLIEGLLRYKRGTEHFPSRSKLPEHLNVEVATAVLLLELDADGTEFSALERVTLETSLKEVFDLSKHQVGQLVAGAEELREDEEQLDKFFSMLLDFLSIDERITVLSLIWRVVLADNRVDNFERGFLVLAQDRFRLSDEDARLAQELARQT